MVIRSSKSDLLINNEVPGSAPGQMAVSETISLHLNTFGVLTLTRDGSPVRGSGQQPKPLALLAFLAASGSKGATRDKILGHIWPDLDTPRARHALKQTVYALRRDADEPRVIVGSNVLRLDPAAVSADVVEFREALSTGSLERAAGIYAGPFLDGFFLEGGGPFEEWAERERSVLARERREILRVLGQRAEPGAALLWWRHLVDDDPLDSPAAQALMRALLANGNPAEAIRVARQHAQALWRDLEATPDPSIMLLAEQIRSSSSAESGKQEPGSPGREIEPPSTPPDLAPVSLPPPPPKRRWLGAVLGASVLVMVIATMWLTDLGRHLGREPSDAVRDTALTIQPLIYRGPANHAHLRTGIGEILRQNLEGVAGLRVVDPRAAASVDSARGPQSELLLEGEIVEVEGRLRIDVKIRRGPAGRPLAVASVAGPLASLFDLTDRLSTDLVAQLRPGSNPGLMRSAAATASLAAFTSYAEGEAHFLAGRYREAVTGFQNAVAEDTTFALAYYRLSLAADWASLTDLAPEAAERAGRHQDRLPEPDRLLLRGYLAWRRGAAQEAERSYRELLAGHPDNVEAWFQLGEVLFHGNPFLGRSISEARRPFERALGFEPGNARAVSHLVRIAAIEKRWPEVDSLLRRLPTPGQQGAEPWVEPFRVRAQGARVLPEKTLDYLRGLDDVLVYTAAERTAVYLGELGMAEVIAALLTESKRPAATRAYGHLTLAELALSQGRWRVAQRELAAAEGLDPARGLAHRGLLTVTLFLPPDSSELTRLRRLFARPLARPRSPVSIYFSWQELAPELLRRYLGGLIDARLHRDSTALVEAARLADFGGEIETRTLAKALAHSLRAVVAWSDGRPDDGLAELERSRLETRLETVRTPFGSVSFERFLRAELLRRVGDSPAALGWYRSMGESTVFDLIYLAPALLESGIIRERLGDRSQAAAAYRRVLRLWDQCDSELRSVRDEAERRLRLIERANVTG